VEEVTVAGNLAEMLRHVTAIGNDLVFRGAVAAPTIRIDGMTVAGSRREWSSLGSIQRLDAQG